MYICIRLPVKEKGGTMKKIILTIAGVIFLAGATVPVLAATPSTKAAVSERSETATSAPETVSPTQAPAEEYALPYPGILQDNPIYFLKTIRDRIMEWLIADPVRKIDFYVLQSDKNLNAGILLSLADKKTLVPGVLTQSIADIEKAVSLASSTKNSGKVVPVGVIEHVWKSLIKHEEVLADFAKKAADTEKGTFETLVAKAKGLEGIVAKLK